MVKQNQLSSCGQYKNSLRLRVQLEALTVFAHSATRNLSHLTYIDINRLYQI